MNVASYRQSLIRRGRSFTLIRYRIKLATWLTLDWCASFGHREKCIIKLLSIIRDISLIDANLRAHFSASQVSVQCERTH